MKAQALYTFAAFFFISGILFFLKGFFLTRVELPSKSTDSLDIYAAFNAIKPDKTLSQRFLSKSVLDLGHSLHLTSKNKTDLIESPYFNLFDATTNENNVLTQGSGQKVSAISPIALLSTIHSMTNSVDQLFTSATQTAPQLTSVSNESFNNPTDAPQSDPQTCSWFCRQYDQIFVFVIDALRFDFIQYNHTLSPDFTPPEISAQHPPYENRLSNLAKFHQQHPNNSNFFKFRADAPTVTMQRLKALLTGSLPTFLDVKDNFAASTIQEDNLLVQMTGKQHHSVMVGDDTWMGLVGPLLTRPYPYPSFDVHDLDTVDNGCIYRIHHELCGRTLTSMKFGLDEYFRQFIHANQLDHANNNEELTQLRKEAKELSKYIEDNLTYEQDSLTSQSYFNKVSKTAGEAGDSSAVTIPNEISYKNITSAPAWLFAHFLGVDHVGHRFSPRHPLMDTKLRQMNTVLQQLLTYIDMYSDHTPNRTKPYSTVFHDRYNFIREHCDRNTTEVFAQKFSTIESLFTRQSQHIKPIDYTQSHHQLHLEKYATKSPTARSVLYILGDHGMTEGGNHGGSSAKETYAGFGVFSTISLDSPSSFLKHQQLHDEATKSMLAKFGSPRVKQFKGLTDIYAQLAQSIQKQPISPTQTQRSLQNNEIIQNNAKLPQLTLTYDYSHIKNYNDVFAQSHIDSTSEEAFSMGQIDYLPTISLITGVPIPYGSLGVMKKELIPNQFVHNHHGRLMGSYEDSWSSMSQICSIFSTFSTSGVNVQDTQSGYSTVEGIHIKVAELRHEIMILHLRVLNLGQVLRYSKDYVDTVKSFSGAFIKHSFVHTRVIWAKLAMIEDSITELTKSCQEYQSTAAKGVSHAAASTKNAQAQVDQLSQILDNLFPAVIDTSHHIHLILAHIKAGYTREWTQFDMVAIYSSITCFILLVVVVLLQLLRYIIRARKNEALYSGSKSNDREEVRPTPGSHWRDRDEDEDGSGPIAKICCFVCNLPFTRETSILRLTLLLLIYTAITTAAISLLPILLFISPANYTDLLIPIPWILTKLNEILTVGVAVEETPATLAQASSSTETTISGNVYTMEITSFLTTLFVIIFFIYFTAYQISRFRITIRHVSNLQHHAITAYMEQHTWSKFFVTIAILIGLLQGLFTNVFVNEAQVIHQTLCSFLTLWTLFTLNGSLSYYFYDFFGSKSTASFASSMMSSDLGDLVEDLGALDHEGDEAMGLIDNESSEDDSELVSLNSDSPSSLTNRGASGDSHDHLPNNSPSSDLGSVQTKPYKSSKKEATGPTINSPFLQKTILTPSRFLLLSVFAFFCIAGMSVEDELTKTNAKLLFNVPYQDHNSLISTYQDVMSGGVVSALTTIFTSADDVISEMTHINLITERQMKADLVKKPKLVDAIVHQRDGDNHKGEEHEDHDNRENNEDKVFVEPDLSAKIDPFQVAKTALNMFSPDIALDGAYVRKESQVMLVVRDATTNEVILGAGQLVTESHYAEHKDTIRTALISKYAHHGRFNDVIVEEVIAAFPNTAVDTRSHYSGFHILLILGLFITSLYILDKQLFMSYQNSQDKTDKNALFPHYVRLYNSCLIPITAFCVSCYWLPNYIALLIQPIVSIFLSFFGTCSNLPKHNLLLNPNAISNTILSANDQLQLCAADIVSARPVFVQVLRLYIPSFVYVAFVLGLVLFAVFVFHFIMFRAEEAVFMRVNSKQVYNAMKQYYSSQQLIAFLFVVLFPTFCLVAGPRSTVIYCLYVLFIESCKHLIQTMFVIIPYNKQLVHLTNFVALFVFITILMFHATGHAYSFNDIHIASGFVGLPGYIFGISETLVLFNTLGGFIFGTFGSLMIGYYTTSFYQQYQIHAAQEEDVKSDDHLQIAHKSHTLNFLSFSRTIPIAWFLFWTSLRLCISTINVTVKRRDLFVWPTFAPYWLMISIMSLVIYAFTLLYSYTLPSENNK